VLILRRGRRRPLLVNAETGPFAGARGLSHFVTFHFDLGLTSPFPFPSQGPWTHHLVSYQLGSYLIFPRDSSLSRGAPQGAVLLGVEASRLVARERQGRLEEERHRETCMETTGLS